jgi:hypothetical protein
MSITKLSTNGIAGAKYDTVSADNYYMEPIATTLLGSSSASVTFSNIPNTYKHLQIRGIVVPATGTASMTVQYNGDATTTNYYYHRLQGTGAAAGAGAGNLFRLLDTTGTGSYFCSFVVDILDYANGNKFKTTRALSGYDANGSGEIDLTSNLWSNTAPITSIKLSSDSANFNTNSRFSLYGIRG